MRPVVHHEADIAVRGRSRSKWSAANPARVYLVLAAPFPAIVEPEAETTLVIQLVAPAAMGQANERGAK